MALFLKVPLLRPFHHLESWDDDDLHERDGEEDDPGRAVPVNIDKGHPKEPRDGPNGIQPAEHGSDAAGHDRCGHQVVHGNKEQQKQRRPQMPPEHAEARYATITKAQKGNLSTS